MLNTLTYLHYTNMTDMRLSLLSALIIKTCRSRSKRRRFSAEVEQHEVVAVDGCLEQANVLVWNSREHVGQQLGRSTSTPIVTVDRRKLDAVGRTDGRQHDVGVSLQSVVVADEVVVNMTRVTKVIVRPPVLVRLRRYVDRVDDVPYELSERYAAALTHIIIINITMHAGMLSRCNNIGSDTYSRPRARHQF